MAAWCFEIERANGWTKKIVDKRIINERIAEDRAIYEFLKNGGYTKEEVEITTYADLSIKLNDIVRIKAYNYKIPLNIAQDRFIVKGIRYSYKRNEALMTLRCVRYNTNENNAM